ncbi:MAG: hypothetical protein GYA50_08125 [Eubacteriaceae bacterium]|nr:hypothetical protein [Eubacteriaceae bacterium]
MEELKCISCGGKVDINEDLMIGVCEYCGTEQALPEDVIENIEYEYRQKNLHKAQKQARLNKRSIFIALLLISIFIVIICVHNSVVYISTVRLAKNLDYNERPTEYVTCYYTPVNELIVTGYLNNVDEVGVVTFKWKHDGENIATTQYFSKSYICSCITNDKTWPEGNYTVEIYIGSSKKPDEVFKFTVLGY